MQIVLYFTLSIALMSGMNFCFHVWGELCSCVANQIPRMVLNDHSLSSIMPWLLVDRGEPCGL